MREIVKQKLEELFSWPQQYLMYRSGAGGEFLLSQIYTKSAKFKNTHFTFPKATDNRTKIDLLFYNHILNLVPLHLINISDRFDHLLDLVVTQAVNEPKAITHLDTSLKILQQHREENFLLKAHEIRCSYFHDKTFLIYTNSNKWQLYWHYLANIKYTISVQFLAERLKDANFKPFTGVNKFRFDLQKNKIEILVDYCLSNNISNLKSSFFNYVLNEYDDMDSLAQAFAIPLAKIVNESQPINHTSNDFIATIDLNNYNVISYDNYFTKGYLEEKFEITGDQFHDNLIEWHEKNLETLSGNGFDINDFKL